MRRFFVLGLNNPLLKYGSWLLFLLLSIRLTYVGFQGTDVPAVGERATTYYVAPRSLTCDKPNPSFGGLAEKLKAEASPVYKLDNSHVESRRNLLRSMEVRLAADIEALIQLARQLESLDQKNKGTERPIKESPYLKKAVPGAGKEDEAASHDRKKVSIVQTIERTEKHLRALLATVAPGLTRNQQDTLTTVFKRNQALLRDSLRAADICLDELGRWFVVETLDFSFQRDRAQGIILGNSDRLLDETQHVFSHVEALDYARATLVVRTISENFPRLKGSKRLATFVTQIAVSAVRPNLRKDLVRTQAVLQEKLNVIPRTTPVEFAQGQSIVALGETVLEWQADCISRFSARAAGMQAMGDFMGIPVPTLLLLLGVGLLVVLGSLALRSFFAKVFLSTSLRGSDYLAVGAILVLHMSLVRLFLFAAGIFALTFPAISKGLMLTACPVAMGVMVLATLLGAKVAFLGLLFLLVGTSMVTIQSGPELLSGNFPAYHILYVLIVSLAGIWVTRLVTRRGSYFIAGMASGGAGLLFWLIVLLVEGGQVPTNHVLQLGLASLASGALSYILLISLAPLFEFLWDYTTDSRLIELSSSEHPALKDLSRRAPGTYQHSLWIATLVEEAAEGIGANPLLAKVGAYYHDLGKLAAAAESGLPRGATESPFFFAENQAMGSNPHDHLSPLVSARILKKHVELSIKMIRRHRLGKKIEDIAAQHHGTSYMEHFHAKAKLLAEQDGSPVDEADYRYPGPKPQSKEAALVMLADSVEAAVRALPHHTEETISERVHNIVRSRRSDGQLDESTLTFGDVKRIEESFIKTLVSMYHARPEYLKLRTEEATVRLHRDELSAGARPGDINTEEILRQDVRLPADEESEPPQAVGLPAEEEGEPPQAPRLPADEESEPPSEEDGS